jgi:uncharacterized protein YdhG (YjbR/CyaY superfamily)
LGDGANLPFSYYVDLNWAWDIKCAQLEISGGARKGVYVKEDKGGYGSIDEYIAGFPEEVQTLLQTVRATIKAAAPDAQEKISYQMPTFTLHGTLVYFAAWKDHIGLYALPTGVEAFREELAPYATSKGTVKLPIDKPLPTDLISRIVRFRADENRKKAEEKTRKK